MCYYCKNDEVMALVQCEPLTALVDVDGKKLVIIDRENKGRHTEGDINYCPMCGRKLWD